jgi:hypothetical protein
MEKSLPNFALRQTTWPSFFLILFHIWTVKADSFYQIGISKLIDQYNTIFRDITIAQGRFEIFSTIYLALQQRLRMEIGLLSLERNGFFLYTSKTVHQITIVNRVHFFKFKFNRFCVMTLLKYALMSNLTNFGHIFKSIVWL